MSGAFEVVIADHEYYENFDQHYLWDLRLWNLHFVIYRRERPEISARSWKGPCNMSAEERILLPNHGRDGAAFYDYILWRYTQPPAAVAFLHGHAALGWHTSCEAVFTRIFAYYISLVSPERLPLPNAMVTLTFARGRKDTQFAPFQWNGGRKLLDKHPEDTSCIEQLGQVNVSLDRAPFSSCCGSFIVPGGVFQRYSPRVYSHLLSYLQNPAVDDYVSGRQCFEFVIYSLFSDPLNRTSVMDRSILEQWFKTAKQMRRQLKTRLHRCESFYGNPYLGDESRLLFNHIWFPKKVYVQR